MEQTTETPKRNQRWVNTKTGQTARIMSAPIDGWIVARYKGAMPWLLHMNDWHKKFVISNVEVTGAAHSEKERER